MMRRDATAYDSWGERPRAMPARSRLFHLEPIGVGTPVVESLTGYIGRLAEAHCVSAAILFARELAPALNKPYLMYGGPRSRASGLSLRTTARLHIRRLNGCTPFASDMVATLEALTMRRDLCFLTMLPWRDVVSTKHLLHTKRAWCPLCYEQWRRDGRPVYEPLLWALSASHVCIDHQVPLATRCPSCGKEMLPLARRSRPGFCARCGFWLGSNTTGRKKAQAGDVEMRAWAAKSAGELLAAAPYLKSEPGKERIGKTLSSCAAQATGGNMAAFGRLIGKHKVVLWDWTRRGMRMRIDDLLSLCHRIHITPLDFLTAGEIAVPPAAAMDPVHTGVSPTGKGSRLTKPFDEEDARRRLEEILAQEQPISMSKACKRLGYSDRTLYKYLPELCRAISARYAAHLKKFYEQERNRRRDEIRHAALRLHAEGIYPSLLRVAPLLEKPGGLHSDFADGVLREIREELGLRRA